MQQHRIQWGYVADIEQHSAVRFEYISNYSRYTSGLTELRDSC